LILESLLGIYSKRKKLILKTGVRQMTDKNDGGPAFPVPNDANVNHQEGMTLRDWFAGQSLAFLGHPNVHGKSGADEQAVQAYKIADAMIRAKTAS
jgi:hypothetical protein